VLVDILGEPDVGMPYNLRDDLQPHALRPQERNAGVPQIVKALLREFGGSHQSVELLQDLPVVNWCPYGAGEDMASFPASGYLLAVAPVLDARGAPEDWQYRSPEGQSSAGIFRTLAEEVSAYLTPRPIASPVAGCV